MHKILIVVVFITHFALAQSIAYHSPYADFQNGVKYYLFGDNVQFRNRPNLTSDVLALLKIGTAITVIDKTDKTVPYNGIASHFYKVQYGDQIGYVLGGLLSLEKKENNTHQFYFTYQKSEEQYSIIIRSLQKGGEINEATTLLQTNRFLIELHDDRGVNGVDSILYISYISESCGVDEGGIYYFQTNNELKKVFEVAEISDAGIYWFAESLIFPEDKNGVPNKIVYTKEREEYMNEEANWVEIHKTIRELEWKDGQILPKITSEE